MLSLYVAFSREPASQNINGLMRRELFLLHRNIDSLEGVCGGGSGGGGGGGGAGGAAGGGGGETTLRRDNNAPQWTADRH